MEILKLESITKGYGGQLALKDISFSVQAGHIHGILGPNGAGKTTALKILTGLLRADSGKIKINGDDLIAFDHENTDLFGVLLEEAPLYKEMQVKEYLEYIAKIRGVEKSQIKIHLDYCIEKLKLADVLNRQIGNLSRGFKQRVAIAQAIIHKPKIVVLDEPTIGLDPSTVIEIRNLILELKKEHTIILSSHMLHEMSLVCDTLTILSGGRVLQNGNLTSIKESLNLKKEIDLESLVQSEQFRQKVKEYPFVQDVGVTEHNGCVKYKIIHNSETEIRPKIVELAVSLNIGLTKLIEKEYTLEDIFVEVIKND